MVIHYPAKFGGDKHRGSGDIMVLICHVISQDLLTEGASNIPRSPFKVSHHPAKFGGHRRCSIGDVMVLVCHVIWQDHMIKRSYDFMS